MPKEWARMRANPRLCGRRMAEAIEHAHARGVRHRDLKPANVKITRAGKMGHKKSDGATEG